jgi:hypothetical protein
MGGNTATRIEVNIEFVEGYRGGGTVILVRPGGVCCTPTRNIEKKGKVCGRSSFDSGLGHKNGWCFSFVFF